jgi:hypothetical protein
MQNGRINRELGEKLGAVSLHSFLDVGAAHLASKLGPLAGWKLLINFHAAVCQI